MYKIACLVLSLFSAEILAETRIAILDFELKDLTLAPNLPVEIQRTAAIKGMLENQLRSAGYRIIDIPSFEQRAADSGVGYLFEHPEAAAALGKKFAADYLLVGRLHKPSFLFIYLMGNLVRTDTGKLVGQFITESKGTDLKLTGKAVENLTVKIDSLLEHRYTPPAPDRFNSSN